MSRFQLNKPILLIDGNDDQAIADFLVHTSYHYNFVTLSTGNELKEVTHYHYGLNTLDYPVEKFLGKEDEPAACFNWMTPRQAYEKIRTTMVTTCGETCFIDRVIANIFASERRNCYQGYIVSELLSYAEMETLLDVFGSSVIEIRIIEQRIGGFIVDHPMQIIPKIYKLANPGFIALGEGIKDFMEQMGIEQINPLKSSHI
jgi:hypothetical protein